MKYWPISGPHAAPVPSALCVFITGVQTHPEVVNKWCAHTHTHTHNHHINPCFRLSLCCVYRTFPALIISSGFVFESLILSLVAPWVVLVGTDRSPDGFPQPQVWWVNFFSSSKKEPPHTSLLLSKSLPIFQNVILDRVSCSPNIICCSPNTVFLFYCVVVRGELSVVLHYLLLTPRAWLGCAISSRLLSPLAPLEQEGGRMEGELVQRRYIIEVKLSWVHWLLMCHAIIVDTNVDKW